MAMPDELRPRQAPPPAPRLPCAITGLPARYRDPATGLPYADLEAYRELKKRQEAGLLAPAGGHGEAASQQQQQQPAVAQAGFPMSLPGAQLQQSSQQAALQAAAAAQQQLGQHKQAFDPQQMFMQQLGTTPAVQQQVGGMPGQLALPPEQLSFLWPGPS